MIQHTALFKFNATASASRISDLMTALLGLKNDVPGVERIVWGENFSDRSEGHTHVVSMDFPDRATLAAFYEHPAHKEVAASMIKPITTDLLLVDYEERG